MLSEAWERAILLGFDGILWIFFLVYDPREKSREARLLSKTGYAIWITAARLIACAGDNLDEEILNRAEFQKLQVLVDVRVTEFRNGHIFGDRVCRTFFLQLWPGGVRLYNIEDEELIPLTSILADVCDRNAENAPPVEILPKSSEKKLSGF